MKRGIMLLRRWFGPISACALVAVPTGGFAALQSTDHGTSAKGFVLDSLGKPLDRATVLVYEARVSKGYSVFCPTCWVDCGKRVLTDPKGRFQIDDLHSGLKFKLLALKSGYAPAFVENVDPLNASALTVNLKRRTPVHDPARVLRGRVIDRLGDPVADAVVEPEGVAFNNATGRGLRFGGGSAWTDPMAVTDEKGNFEISSDTPVERMMLRINARGRALKLIDEPLGTDRMTITVTDGVSVVGRLVDPGGKPVANAEIAMKTYSHRSGEGIGNIRIGTREDGSFALPNVPPGRVWVLVPTMGSLAPRQLVGDLVPLNTGKDGETLDVGQLRLHAALSVRGKIVTSDGRSIPPDMHVTLVADYGYDSQVADLSPDGAFEFKGLAKGAARLSPGVAGYEMTDRFAEEIIVDRDRDDVVLRMHPANRER